LATRAPWKSGCLQFWEGIEMQKKSMLVVISALLVFLGSGVLAQAQEIPYRISDKQVEQLMHRLKRDSARFRKSLDSALDRSRLDGTNREDDINSFVKDFDKETATLYSRFKDHKSVASDVQTVLDRASRIERFMHRQRFRNGKAERDWSTVRLDLDQLAQAYNVTWTWGT
jgi:hypothetical protein